MKLSIVVPVYNTERYIRQCITSIIQQDGNCFSEIELIIVNDGTKDQSIEQIKDLIEEYDNITLLNQNNLGLSLARNNGIKASKGEYVWCIDSDDWIQHNALSIILPLLDGKNDLLKMYATVHTDIDEKESRIPFDTVSSFTGPETFRNGVAQIATSVLLVYRKQFLEDNNLWFMPQVYHEDNEFCPRVCYLSSCTTVVPYHLYVIRRTINDGRESITTSVNPKRSFDMLKCMGSLALFNKDVVKEQDIKHRIDGWIGQGITMAIEIIIQSGETDIKKFNHDYYSNYRYLTSFLAGGKSKYKVEAMLFRLFPHHIVQCYEVLNIFNPNRRDLSKR